MNILKLNKMCRVCLNVNVNKVQSVFDEIISLKLKICGGINIEQEIHKEYPNLICESCCKNLEIAYNFRVTCENSQKSLNDIMLELQSTTKNARDIEILDEFKSSSSEEMLVDRIDLNLAFKTESIEHVEDSGSVKDIFQHDEYGEPKLGINKNKDNISNINDLETNVIRKYVKKSIKVEEVPPNVRVKRKYTKKPSAINTKLAKEDSKYVCEFCNLEYKGKSSFTYHMRRHTNELNYVCEICGTAFETNFKLKRHFLKHMGTLPYSCKSCDMKFSSSSNRDRHERRLHTTIRPFQCVYCEKAFSYSDQLKNHIRVHTGEKPYVCEKCGSAFKRKSHLSAHSNALTPCVMKMTLKNKINGEKTKVQKITKIGIKSKNTKSIGKKKLNTISENKKFNLIDCSLPNSEHSINRQLTDSDKVNADYINNRGYHSSSVEATKNIPNQSTVAIPDYENDEQLNFYNLGNERNDVLGQNTFLKKDNTVK